MSEPRDVKYDKSLTSIRREVIVIYLAEVSGLGKKRIEDMIIEAYPRQCEAAFKCMEHLGNQPTDECMAVRVERDVWKQVMKSVSIARGQPAEDFPYPFRYHAVVWKEGMPVSPEYLAYRAGRISQEEEMNQGSQASTDAKANANEEAAQMQPSRPAPEPQVLIPASSTAIEAVTVHPEKLEQDDLRVIYKHRPRQINMGLTHRWPTLVHWTQDKEGQQVSIRLQELTAAIMFLRRMYAFWDGKDLSGGKPTRLTSLAWKKNPLSEETKPEEIQDLLNELGFSMSDAGNPTFEDILQHETMGNFWGTASMLMFCRKAIKETPNGQTKFARSEFSKDYWKKGMIEMDSHTSIEKAVTEHISQVLRPKDGSKITPLCNFPPFIRVKYQANKENSQPPQRFSDLRRFRLRGTTLVGEKDAVQQEHDYVLIACFLKPNETNGASEVRLYSEEGRNLVPVNKPPFALDYIYSTSSTRRIGDPGIRCILLYGKASRPQDIEDEACSEIADLDVRQSVDETFFSTQKAQQIERLVAISTPRELRVPYTRELPGYKVSWRPPSPQQTQLDLSPSRPGPSTQIKPPTGEAGGNKRPHVGNNHQPSSRPRLHSPTREPRN
ncbi:hypothetical protein O1611_g1705 [Lasiodiplodia mahajangana]|uniref:Uncharacterized protein n=1 Tax=Lasiodiplodia mahajangana TaxID=1108764 RepID=A0ACC2JXI1_9PEZI|nr:hypothetical protein O1611_g1705 [Lasiodiplodia mahajangana]